MPEKSCSIISVKFMDQIIREKVYCPRMYEVRPIRLAKPPHKKHMKEELLRVMAAQVQGEPAANLMNWVRRKDVDVYWMTCVLYMLDEKHVFFDRSYSRIPKQNSRGQLNPINEGDFANYNAMFADLPVPKTKRKPYVARTLFQADAKPSKME